jgi:hypothetical protein
MSTDTQKDLAISLGQTIYTNTINNLHRQLEDMTAQFEAARDGCEAEANAATQLRQQLEDEKHASLHESTRADAYMILSDTLKQQLAESQAREQQLREALAWASDNLTRGATSEFEADDECTCPACKALYIPTDDTALREMIAKAVEDDRKQR